MLRNRLLMLQIFTKLIYNERKLTTLVYLVKV
jgi:hypothetical protein